MGVKVEPNRKVTGCDAHGVTVDGGRIEAATVVWAAGIVASPAAVWIGAEHDRAGRIKVNADLSVPGRPEIFAVGDTASVSNRDGRQVPGIAPAAKQMGRYVAEVVAARVRGRPAPPPFVYHHMGELATIGRKSAVVKLARCTHRIFGLAVLERRPHLFFDRIAQPLRGRAELAVDLYDVPARRAAHRNCTALSGLAAYGRPCPDHARPCTSFWFW